MIESVDVEHPAWCDRRFCRGVEHVSDQYPVEGAVPLVVELMQRPGETGPRLSILEREGMGVVTIPAQETAALLDVLTRIPVR